MEHVVPPVTIDQLDRAHVTLVVDQVHKAHLDHHQVDQCDGTHLLPHVAIQFPSLHSGIQNILVIQVNDHHKTSE